jgi:hypothetical protein
MLKERKAINFSSSHIFWASSGKLIVMNTYWKALAV